MHDVQALISKTEALVHATRELRNAVLCKLPQGLSLLPITGELKAELGKLPEAAGFSKSPIEEIAPNLHTLALKVSEVAPVASKGSILPGIQQVAQ
jgi:hypothetical protein